MRPDSKTSRRVHKPGWCTWLVSWLCCMTGLDPPGRQGASPSGRGKKNTRKGEAKLMGEDPLNYELRKLRREERERAARSGQRGGGVEYGRGRAPKKKTTNSNSARRNSALTSRKRGQETPGAVVVEVDDGGQSYLAKQTTNHLMFGTTSESESLVKLDTLQGHSAVVGSIGLQETTTTPGGGLVVETSIGGPNSPSMTAPPDEIDRSPVILTSESANGTEEPSVLKMGEVARIITPPPTMIISMKHIPSLKFGNQHIPSTTSFDDETPRVFHETVDYNEERPSVGPGTFFDKKKSRKKSRNLDLKVDIKARRTGGPGHATTPSMDAEGELLLRPDLTESGLAIHAKHLSRGSDLLHPAMGLGALRNGGGDSSLTHSPFSNGSLLDFQSGFNTPAQGSDEEADDASDPEPPATKTKGRRASTKPGDLREKMLSTGEESKPPRKEQRKRFDSIEMFHTSSTEESNSNPRKMTSKSDETKNNTRNPARPDPSHRDPTRHPTPVVRKGTETSTESEQMPGWSHTYSAPPQGNVAGDEEETSFHKMPDHVQGAVQRSGRQTTKMKKTRADSRHLSAAEKIVMDNMSIITAHMRTLTEVTGDISLSATPQPGGAVSDSTASEYSAMVGLPDSPGLTVHHTSPAKKDRLNPGGVNVSQGAVGSGQPPADPRLSLGPAVRLFSMQTENPPSPVKSPGGNDTRQSSPAASTPISMVATDDEGPEVDEDDPLANIGKRALGEPAPDASSTSSPTSSRPSITHTTSADSGTPPISYGGVIGTGPTEEKEGGDTGPTNNTDSTSRGQRDKPDGLPGPPAFDRLWSTEHGRAVNEGQPTFERRWSSDGEPVIVAPPTERMLSALSHATRPKTPKKNGLRLMDVFSTEVQGTQSKLQDLSSPESPGVSNTAPRGPNDLDPGRLPKKKRRRRKTTKYKGRPIGSELLSGSEAEFSDAGGHGLSPEVYRSLSQLAGRPPSSSNPAGTSKSRREDLTKSLGGFGSEPHQSGGSKQIPQTIADELQAQFEKYKEVDAPPDNADRLLELAKAPRKGSV